MSFSVRPDPYFRNERKRLALRRLVDTDPGEPALYCSQQDIFLQYSPSLQEEKPCRAKQIIDQVWRGNNHFDQYKKYIKKRCRSTNETV